MGKGLISIAVGLVATLGSLGSVFYLGYKDNQNTPLRAEYNYLCEFRKGNNDIWEFITEDKRHEIDERIRALELNPHLRAYRPSDLTKSAIGISGLLGAALFSTGIQKLGRHYRPSLTES
jgi:hypothetical protein